MKKLIEYIKVLLVAAPMVALYGSLSSCSDSLEGTSFVTPSDSLATLTVIDVMKNESLTKESYTMWLDMLQKANYYNALNNADANTVKATVFAPTDEAVQKFLARRGLSSIDEIDPELLKCLVQQHIIDCKTSSVLNDDELKDYAQRNVTYPNVTLFNTPVSFSYGKTKVDCDDAQRDYTPSDVDNIYINNKASVANPVGYVCKNGVIYAMSEVIEPVAETIVETLENSGRYNIFVQAIREAGYEAVANNKQVKLTCFAVPDAVYAQNGINDLNALKAYIAANTSGEGLVKTLEEYVQYHFISRVCKTSELFKYLNPEEDTNIFDVALKGKALITNNISGTNYINKNVNVIRSDWEARNGIIHKVGNIMPAYVPAPVLIKWDFLNQPDVIALVDDWGAKNSDPGLYSRAISNSQKIVNLFYYNENTEQYSQVTDNGTITSFKYKIGTKDNKSNGGSWRAVGFYKDTYRAVNTPDISLFANKQSDGTFTDGAYLGNYLCLSIGLGGEITFTTPTIIAGKYDVILHLLYTGATMESLFKATGSSTSFKLITGYDSQKDYNVGGKPAMAPDTISTSKALYKGIKTIARGPNANPNQSVTQEIFADLELKETKTHTFTIKINDQQAKDKSNYRLLLDYLEFKPKN